MIATQAVVATRSYFSEIIFLFFFQLQLWIHVLLYRVLVEDFAIYKAMDFRALVPRGLRERPVKVKTFFS